MAYNCSPSFNWRKHLDDDGDRGLPGELGELGYKFQFITLAGFHSLNAAMFELARGYVEEGMPAYVRVQEREFELEADGYGNTPPARGRRRVLRRRCAAHLRRSVVDAGAQGLDGRGPVPRRASSCLTTSSAPAS